MRTARRQRFFPLILQPDCGEGFDAVSFDNGIDSIDCFSNIADADVSIAFRAAISYGIFQI